MCHHTRQQLSSYMLKLKGCNNIMKIPIIIQIRKLRLGEVKRFGPNSHSKNTAKHPDCKVHIQRMYMA